MILFFIYEIIVKKVFVLLHKNIIFVSKNTSWQNRNILISYVDIRSINFVFGISKSEYDCYSDFIDDQPYFFNYYNK